MYELDVGLIVKGEARRSGGEVGQRRAVWLDLSLEDFVQVKAENELVAPHPAACE